MGNKVKISFKLLVSILSLLENIDADDYDQDFAQLFGYVSHSLNSKKFAFVCKQRFPTSYDDFFCHDSVPF